MVGVSIEMWMKPPIHSVDWVVDLGPEGGDKGGEIVAQGTPRDVAKIKKSHTGKYLSKVFGNKK